jgi:hypothetical protein
LSRRTYAYAWWFQWIGQQRWSHAILALNSGLPLVLNLQTIASWSQRKAHRLNMVVEHHTSIHAIIHKASSRTKFRTIHQIIKEIWKLTYVLLWTHKREKHANRSLRWKRNNYQKNYFIRVKAICLVYFVYKTMWNILI